MKKIIALSFIASMLIYTQNLFCMLLRTARVIGTKKCIIQPRHCSGPVDGKVFDINLVQESIEQLTEKQEQNTSIIILISQQNLIASLLKKRLKANLPLYKKNNLSTLEYEETVDLIEQYLELEEKIHTPTE